MNLTGSLKTLFTETAQTLKAYARRRVMAQTVKELGPGGQRQAERELGWNRETIRKGMREVESGMICLDNFGARGRKLSDEHLPNLLRDITTIVDSQSQTDPQFRTQRLYTRLDAAEVRQQLIKLIMFKNIVWQILRNTGFCALILRLHPKSALVENAWFRSFKDNPSVDRNGEPIPWFTYPAIHFIETRLTKEMRVFEYGCGYSTLWFSNRVCQIISVEHDQHWSRVIEPKLRGNAQIILKGLDNGYSDEIIRHGKFDIAVIDGRNRSDCFRYSLAALKDTGIIIWDDSKHQDFEEGLNVVSSKGYRAIRFQGMVPAIFISSETSLIYPKNNCFNI